MEHPKKTQKTRVTRSSAKSKQKKQPQSNSNEERPSESKVIAAICKDNSNTPVAEIPQPDATPDSPKKRAAKKPKMDDEQDVYNVDSDSRDLSNLNGIGGHVNPLGSGEYCVLIFLFVFIAGIFVPDAWRKYFVDQFW